MSAVTSEGEEGCEGGNCAARLLPSIKVRIHTYAWAGRDVSRLVPPAGRDPSIPLLRLVQFCHDQSQQDYAGQDQSEQLRRYETAPPDAARPVQALCVYASLGKHLAPILNQLLAASAWSNCSTIQQLKVRSQWSLKSVVSCVANSQFLTRSS